MRMIMRMTMMMRETMKVTMRMMMVVIIKGWGLAKYKDENYDESEDQDENV